MGFPAWTRSLTDLARSFVAHKNPGAASVYIVTAGGLDDVEPRANFVDLAGVQTLTGQKTFSARTVVTFNNSAALRLSGSSAGIEFGSTATYQLRRLATNSASVNVLYLDNAPFKVGEYTTAGRPLASAASLAGAMIFDTTLGIPVWSNGTTWVDALGTPV